MKKKIIIPTLILAAALTGCTPNENESSSGVISTSESSSVTDSTVESTTESTVESVAGTQSTTTSKSISTEVNEPYLFYMLSVTNCKQITHDKNRGLFF